MTRVPKSIKNHYVDSFLINSENLKSFLSSHEISNTELEDVSFTISKLYNQKMEAILESCGNDWARLDSASSPLILFVQCIDELLSEDHSNISSRCRFILNSFSKTLESWMIW
ncbi:hypothetical protein NMY3_00795 [Candidatus Nitrosocosmicus oleophilus]|uniref:Uncharacterized protein n=1 Tax=Candidatus Nitrosocosmicus oleophilus TaxID=1353260 RepID=A0A654LU98_9ARCH|nr:hypothetical protein NMY3_00795 [Candidatus Nitrosocosmicus oleophilus]